MRSRRTGQVRTMPWSSLVAMHWLSGDQTPQARALELALMAWVFHGAESDAGDSARLHCPSGISRDSQLARALPADVGATYARVLSPSQTLMAQERVARLDAAFDSLPDDYREVLTLARIARLGRSEI